MTTLVNTFKAKESDTLVWTLEERRGSQNNLVWVMWLEDKGVKMNKTKTVSQRLSKELKEWFNVK